MQTQPCLDRGIKGRTTSLPRSRQGRPSTDRSTHGRSVPCPGPSPPPGLGGATLHLLSTTPGLATDRPPHATRGCAAHSTAQRRRRPCACVGVTPGTPTRRSPCPVGHARKAGARTRRGPCPVAPAPWPPASCLVRVRRSHESLHDQEPPRELRTLRCTLVPQMLGEPTCDTSGSACRGQLRAPAESRGSAALGTRQCPLPVGSDGQRESHSPSREAAAPPEKPPVDCGRTELPEQRTFCPSLVPKGQRLGQLAGPTEGPGPTTGSAGD